MLRRLRRVAGVTVGGGVVLFVGLSVCQNYNQNPVSEEAVLAEAAKKGDEELKRIPSRMEMLKRLKSGEELDILFIGGGATGAGAALDAAARGLNVACVEREDFSSGTSSRSTKLIWGGSRYLVNAFISLLNPDMRLLTNPSQTITRFVSEVRMVLNCHRERRFLLEKQPHLTSWMPIAVPISEWILWPPPFGFVPAALGPLGLFPVFFQFYDALGGFCSPPSHIMTSKRAARKYPMLTDRIKYSSIFYEGMHDDARTNLAIAVTAAQHGAVVANYINVVGLVTAGQIAAMEIEEKNRSRGWFGSPVSQTETQPDEPQKVVGAIVRDELTGETFTIRAKAVTLCGGPFTDSLRELEEAAANSSSSSGGAEMKKAIRGATGIHIVLPSYYAPDGIGLVDMNTSDGRFLFLLPWQGHVLIGTTDTPAPKIEMNPLPEEAQIQWLLKECSKYLSPEIKVRREDVLSAWSGIRPLAIDPHAKDTSAVSRDHVISVNTTTGVVFISGGKWTTYREMAEDLVDRVLSVSFQGRSKVVKPCSTLDIALNGREGYTSNLCIRLAQEYGVSKTVATQLAQRYGGHAHEVLRIAQASDSLSKKLRLSEPLVSGHDYLRAEVIYAVRHEWALRAEDVIARRLRLAFLNKRDAQSAVPAVVEIMTTELGWSAARSKEETRRCLEFLDNFGGVDPR